MGFSGPVYVKIRNITWLHHLSLHCYCIFFVVTKEIFPITPPKVSKTGTRGYKKWHFRQFFRILGVLTAMQKKIEHHFLLKQTFSSW